ncbi:DNA circularization N-terminal domain-containing protein [Cedecea neteri]|uniref:DNA circularization protein n=1 Tax=Cedecea neteri TaxID=158822 RepID=UPI002AA92509|nr:DNA circularization N-terminal domain-containing protein [Cedecea neteri]WPU22560.1 DNA circularization N-terminal domain-containing protein [Cedecea neteri]
MSWEESLQDASFRGVNFDVLNTRDSVSRDISIYEYPYVDGGDVDDLGRKPRNVRATALFWGDDYETRLRAFLAALDKSGSAELIHPVFGSMPYMQCIEYQVAHEAENVDYCIVEVVFLQARTGIAFFGSDSPLSQADIIFNKVQSALDKAQTAIDNVLSPLRTAKKWMKRAKSLATASLNMVTVLKGDLKDFVNTTTDFINYPKAYMNDLQSALSLKSFSSKSSVSNNPGAYAGSSSDVTGVASIVIADWKSGNAALQDVSVLPEKLATGQVTGAVVTPSGSSASDVTELATAVKIQVALQLALDASDILSDDSIITLLSPADVEQIANDTRAAIQVAIDQTRTTFAGETQNVSSSATASGVTWQPVVDSLKDIALAVQALGTSVITQRPPLTTRTVDSDCNLHLLAHLWYADYSRAAELLRLNPTLRNPNNLKVGDVLNAYSR